MIMQNQRYRSGPSPESAVGRGERSGAWLAICGVILSLLAPGLRAQPATAPEPAGLTPQASLTIHPESPSRPYSRFLFGGFIEHFDGQIYGGIFEPGSPLSDAHGYRQDVIAALKELKLAIVLAGDSPDAYNDLAHPDRVEPIKTNLTFTHGIAALAPHSITIVKLGSR
jgi:hypothetical protein